MTVSFSGPLQNYRAEPGGMGTGDTGTGTGDPGTDNNIGTDRGVEIDVPVPPRPVITATYDGGIPTNISAGQQVTVRLPLVDPGGAATHAPKF